MIEKENRLILNHITFGERILSGKNSEKFGEYKKFAQLLLGNKSKHVFEDEILSKYGSGVTLEYLFELHPHRFLEGFSHERDGKQQTIWYDLEACEEVKREDQFFPYFFACKLRQIDLFDIENFLGFHLAYSFDKNYKDFFSFLNILLKKYRHSHFNTEIEGIIKEWVDEKKGNSKTELAGVTDEKLKGKIKRTRDDNMTRLNQEQTALLVYYLRQNKIILKDEYLNNTDAGQAFAMLTGYSPDTMRQNLNKSEIARIATKKNTTFVISTVKTLVASMENNIEIEE
jgi:hypothetical protein